MSDQSEKFTENQGRGLILAKLHSLNFTSRGNLAQMSVYRRWHRNFVLLGGYMFLALRGWSTTRLQEKSKPHCFLGYKNSGALYKKREKSSGFLSPSKSSSERINLSSIDLKQIKTSHGNSKQIWGRRNVLSQCLPVKIKKKQIVFFKKDQKRYYS